jgi:hypothetical protein
MMGSEKKLPWYLRIMYALPVLLCVIITIVAIITYTRVDSPVTPASETTLKEETERGKEILEEIQEENQGEA